MAVQTSWPVSTVVIPGPYRLHRSATAVGIALRMFSGPLTVRRAFGAPVPPTLTLRRFVDHVVDRFGKRLGSGH